MTIKHVDAEGHERVFEVDIVNFDPETKVVKADGQTWTCGRIYLMNKWGKTVSVWQLNK